MSEVSDSIAHIEALQPLMIKQLNDHEYRIRALEVSVAKISVYIGFASVIGSLIGGAAVQLFFK